MCGIAGYISKTRDLDESVLRHFVSAQHHRGPDASGIFNEGPCGLAHNRLSILDTGSGANQPFVSADGRYVIVYNGEIYNFRELKEKISIPLKTTSDTEIVVELFARFGKNCVPMLRGMFAFALFDRKEKELWLVRDRLGIKPLYYYKDQEHFLFSSELNALAKLPALRSRLSLNQEALCHYLHLGFVPESTSCFSQIQKLESGTITCIRQDLSSKSERYWNLGTFAEKVPVPYAEARKNVKELLYQSVEEHLISDVPLGLFLSGGVDSSLLTAIVCDISEQKTDTFTIGIPGLHDETTFARQIAAHLGTRHHEKYLTNEDTKRLLGQLQKTYGEPFADTSAIPTLLVSEYASEFVKVVLSGEGADELFFGYGTHTWARRLQSPLLNALKLPVKLASRFFRWHPLSKLHSILSKTGSPYQSGNLYSGEHGFFSAKQITQLTGKNYPGFAYVQGKEALTEHFLFEMEVALKDGLLVKMDRATMHYGLEARVPYLDHRLVEYAASLPFDVLTQGSPKQLLKDILSDLLPPSYFNRAKWGFGLSGDHFLKSLLPLKQPVLPKNELTLQEKFCLYNLEQLPVKLPF